MAKRQATNIRRGVNSSAIFGSSFAGECSISFDKSEISTLATSCSAYYLFTSEPLHDSQFQIFMLGELWSVSYRWPAMCVLKGLGVVEAIKPFLISMEVFRRFATSYLCQFRRRLHYLRWGWTFRDTKRQCSKIDSYKLRLWAYGRRKKPFESKCGVFIHLCACGHLYMIQRGEEADKWVLFVIWPVSWYIWKTLEKSIMT